MQITVDERLRVREKGETEPCGGNLERAVASECDGDIVELRRRPAVALDLAIRIVEDEIGRDAQERVILRKDARRIEFGFEASTEVGGVEAYASDVVRNIAGDARICLARYESTAQNEVR
jgi:hypothetical protein